MGLYRGVIPQLELNTLLAYKCLEKYADEIAFHFVFPIPAEAGILAGTHSAVLVDFGSLILELHQYSCYLLQSAVACVFLYLPRICTAIVTAIVIFVITVVAYDDVEASSSGKGTAAHRQRADMMHGKARIPLSFWQSSDSSLAITSPTLNLKPKMMALIDTSLV
ncbi:hypothetical protein V6N12_065800 [Hibiscus sabdariffa]|uniref:Uncharacterized protein n=1 Tax=Hibiscus sabdariffa TaxID=183260 RepID=A0ABR2GAK8_9ROSI